MHEFAASAPDSFHTNAFFAVATPIYGLKSALRARKVSRGAEDVFSSAQ